MTTRRTTARTTAANLRARAVQSFDARGECEHLTISTEFGTPHLVWSARDECIWCGTGVEWK